MIKFGPAGNSESFYNEGNKATLQMPKWLKQRGLDVFEYSFGKGVSLSEATAKAIGEEAKLNGIELSVHAPYYINLASDDDEKGILSYHYILQSLTALSWLGGRRCVFHSGTEGKQKRCEAINRIIARLKEFSLIKHSEGFDNFIICPETMGKLAQICDVAEIIEFCKIDESFYPCVDFGHINAR
ncbi:MAG: TIM barrel protein, partial [Clostridia bacterium]